VDWWCEASSGCSPRTAGFRPKRVLTFLSEWATGFFSRTESYAFQDRVANELAALSRVKRISATTNLALSGIGSVSWIFLPDRVPDGTCGYRIFVRAGYFETMGIRLVAGRDPIQLPYNR